MSDWHQDVAHQWFIDQAQGWLVESYQGLFEQVFLYLAAALDGDRTPTGRPSSTTRSSSGAKSAAWRPTRSTGIQTVTFGSAAGAMNTGLYCDYRQNGQTTTGAILARTTTRGGRRGGASRDCHT